MLLELFIFEGMYVPALVDVIIAGGIVVVKTSMSVNLECVCLCSIINLRTMRIQHTREACVTRICAH